MRFIILDDNVAEIRRMKNFINAEMCFPDYDVLYVTHDGKLKNVSDINKVDISSFIHFDFITGEKNSMKEFARVLCSNLKNNDILFLDIALSHTEKRLFDKVENESDFEQVVNRIKYTNQIVESIISKEDLVVRIALVSTITNTLGITPEKLKDFLDRSFRGQVECFHKILMSYGDNNATNVFKNFIGEIARDTDINACVDDIDEILATASEKQKENTLKIRDIHLLQERDIVYHYTTLDTFWDMIGSDTFRATHLRFSNDDEEYLEGKAILENLMKKENEQMGTLHKDNDSHYMICFCTRGNILSQWRGYTSGAGVSIQMDFSRQKGFTVNAIQNIIGESEKGKNISSLKPIEVLYSKSCDGISKAQKGILPICEGIQCNSRNSGSDECNSHNSGSDECNLTNASKATFLIKDLKEQYDYNVDFQNTFPFGKIIPFIKNGDFSEEREVRLVFSIPKDEEHKYVDYDRRKDSKINRPYINVTCKKGSTDNEGKVEVIGNVNDIQKIRGAAEKKGVEVDVISGNEDNSNGIGCVYIPEFMDHEDQKELFYEIDNIVNKNRDSDQEIKIFCDGFWPIRSILVGPTRKKELIAENIRHYCRNKYWLKHVVVEFTRMPFRED